MFCGSCGKQIEGNTAFCTGCGTKVGGSAQPPPAISQKGSVQLGYGALLIAGDGEYIRRSPSYILLQYAFIISFVGLLAGVFGAFAVAAGESAGWLIFIGAISLYFFIASLIYLKRKGTQSRTHIKVYEQFITGAGIREFKGLEDFTVPFSEVKVVDVVEKRHIIMRTTVGTFTCYTQKATPIRAAIISRLQQNGGD
jgi:hypothetical protein